MTGAIRRASTKKHPLGRSIRSDERALFVGKTGTGKTYLARYLLAPVPRLIVIDPKPSIDPEEWRLRPYHEGIDALAENPPKRDKSGRIVPIRLRVGSLPPHEYESYFADIMARVRSCVVYIDELYGVGPMQGSPGLQSLYTRGRQLGLGVWGATQRPSRIPVYAMSEAEWVFMFQLKVPDDRDRMANELGRKAYIPLKKYNFLAYNDDMEAPVLWRKLDV